MGAEYFSCRAEGKNAREAFKAAQEQAWYDHGHSGYSGTIAEKPGFTLVERLPGESVEKAMDRLDDSNLVNDKWGNCAALKGDTEGEYIFFGWASS